MRTKKAIAVSGALAVAAAVAVGYTQRPYWFFKPNAPASASSQQSAPVQLWHCGMHPQVIQDHPGFCPICHMALTPMSAHDTTHGGLTVTIDPTVVQNMGLRTAMAVRGPLDLSVQTAGVLKIPEPAMWDISPRTNGWITHLYADTEGAHVHKGEVLFDFYSPDLQSAEVELLELVHAQKMEAGASPDRQRAAKADVIAARQKLSIRGVAEQDVDAIATATTIPDTVPIRSPADGAVTEKTVVQGSSVTAGQKLMRIEEHSQLWLDCEVYEDQMVGIAVGEKVTASFDALPGQKFTGKVSFVFPHIDPSSRTEMVRTILENPDLTLKPGMYATVNLLTPLVTDAVLVPREAVIDTGSSQIAFVALSDGHFEPRKVRIGHPGDNDQIQILDGISAGESVVTSGQFLLDVESRTLEAIEKLRAPQPEMLHPAKDDKGGMP